MKKILFVIVFACLALYAQQDKGKIKLEFDGDIIELPFNMVEIRKDNEITVVARGEKNDDSGRIQISLEYNVGKITDDPHGINLQISINNKLLNTGKEFLLTYNSKNEVVAHAQFGRSRSGERITWEANKMHLLFKNDEVKFDRGNILLKGSFNGTCETGFEGITKKQIMEIKNATFEIIF